MESLGGKGMIKLFKRSPLPFQGQKRYWIPKLLELSREIPEGATIVDVFGGSGLCANTFKFARPDCRVIWNDFDDFRSRLEKIPQTNVFASELGAILGKYEKGARITPGEDDHGCIVALFERAEVEGADMHTLAQSVTFSGDSTSKITPQRILYNNMGSTCYDATGYLEGVERVSLHFQELLPSLPEDAILVLDPPYLSTDVGRYGQKQEGVYWGVAEHLRLVRNLVGMKYLYFTSDKSEVLKMEEVAREAFGVSWFGEYRTFSRRAHMCGKDSQSYTDILITNIPDSSLF